MSFDLLIVVRSAKFLKRTLTKRFDNVFLLRQLRDISNEVGSYLEKNSKLLVVDTLHIAMLDFSFCGNA